MGHMFHLGHLKGKLYFLESMVKEYQNNSITFNWILFFNLLFNISTFWRYYLDVEEKYLLLSSSFTQRVKKFLVI